MTRFTLLLVVSALSVISTYGQCVVYKHEDGRVLTTCDFYATGQQAATTAGHTQRTYLGSPFLTFPIWQPGIIQLDTHGQELNCELAYNLVTNEVLCRFPGDSTVKLITPAVFTINKLTFARQQNKLLGIDYQLYTTVLYDGPTKLLVSLVKPAGDYVLSSDYKTDASYKTSAIVRENAKADVKISGTYSTKINYYIRKGEAKPERITLTKSTLLEVLYEQARSLTAKLPDRNLTTDEVAQALQYYDRLMAASRISKLPLLTDPIFMETLHTGMRYPEYARSQGVYGRVYAGFEIDEAGTIKNITILSPDNGGFRFDIVVRNALAKLPAVNPAYRGNYALPVAFVYTNTKETTGSHTPVNYLSEDRLKGRTVLDEYVVEGVVAKSGTASKEVWGYFN